MGIRVNKGGKQMNNFWKKTAAGIMALLIVAAASPMQPITQFAKTAVMNAYAEDVTATLNDDGVLTLSGKVSKAQVWGAVGKTSLNDDVENVTSITASAGTILPENCSDLFSNFKSVKEIDLSNADSSNVTDMSQMFYNCQALNSISFGDNFDTSNVTNMFCMFTGCSSLAELDLSSFDTSNVTDMCAMFEYCMSLVSLDVSSFDTSKIHNMERMFADCASLLTLDLSSFNLTGTITIAMFARCNGLTEIIVGDGWNKDNIINESYYKGMFEGCINLPNYNSSEIDADKAYVGEGGYLSGTVYLDGDTLHLRGHVGRNQMEAVVRTGVKTIVADKGTILPEDCSALFEGFTEVTSIDLSNADTSNVKNMSAMFLSCTSLTSLNLSSFDTSAVTDMSDMFRNCLDLKDIIVSDGWDTRNALNSENMFFGCDVVTDGGAFDKTYAYVGGDGYLSGTAYLDGDTLHLRGHVSKALVRNADKTAVTKIAADKGTILPEDCSELFLDFTNVTSIDLSKADTSAVTYMNSMFRGCTSLTSLDLSSFKTSEVTDMGAMFAECTSLTTLDLSGFDTSNVSNMNGMFNGCSSLTSLDLRSFDTSNVTDMGAMFFIIAIDAKLTSILIGDGWNTDKVVNDDWMFYGCTKLPNFDGNEIGKGKANSEAGGYLDYQVTISGDITREYLKSVIKGNVTKVVAAEGTKLPADCDALFYSFNKVRSIDLSKVDTSAVTDMSNMFYGCNALTTLDLSSFNTSNVTEMSCMFYGCSKLTDIIVGDGWNTDSVSYSCSTGMFSGCGNVPEDGIDNKTIACVGGDGYLKGTTYTTTEGEDTVLHLRGHVSKTHVAAADKSAVTKIVADEGTVLPADCSNLFEGFDIVTNIDLSKADTSNVTNMYSMFEYCTSLTSLDVSKFDTSNVKNMNSMFSDCSSLTSLDLSSFDTSNVTDMGLMFNNCSSLTSLDVSKFDTSNVEYMNGMFENCSSLTSLDLSSFDTSSVTDMNYVFSDCTNLTEIIVGDGWNTEKASDNYHADGMFTGCGTETLSGTAYIDGDTLHLRGHVSKAHVRDVAETSRATITKIVADKGVVLPADSSDLFADFWKAKAIDLSNADTSGVTEMHFMFSGCVSTKSIDVSSFDTSKVENMDCMFGSCSSLTSLDVSSFNTSNVKSMGYMFRSCSKLTTLDLSGFDTSNVEDMEFMFKDCSALTSLDISKFDTSKVKNMESMFSDCQSLTSLNVSSFDTSIVTLMDYMFYGCEKLTTLDLSKFDTSSVTRMDDMFNGCKALTSITFGDNFDTSKVEDMNHMFGSCPALTSLDVSNFDTSNVSDMAFMFDGCSSLTSLDLSSFDTSKVENMNSMFVGCTSLISLDLSSFNTANVTSMGAMFRDCSSLGSLDFSSFDTSKVTNMDNMFNGCSNLKTIKVGLNWNTGSVTISDDMFKGCGIVPEGGAVDKTNANYGENGYLTLKTDVLTLSGNVTAAQLAHVDKAAVKQIKTAKGTVLPANCSGLFSNFKNATSIDLSKADTSNVTDMHSMFEYCSSLESIDLSSFDTSNVTDMNYMFYGCSKLTEIIVGDGWNIEKAEADNHALGMFSGCGTTTTTGTTYTTTEGEDTVLHLRGHVSKAHVAAADKSVVTKIVADEGTVLPADCSHLFALFEEVTNIDLSKADTSNVTDMSYMFFNCSSLTSLDVSSFDTSNVTDMSYMFYICSSLTSLDVSKFDTSKVTYMHYMFDGCSALKTLDVSKFDTSNVTNMNYMFNNCSSLESLDLSNFNTSNVTDMRYMFQSCTALTNLDLSSFDTSKVTNAEEMFIFSEKLEKLTLGSGISITEEMKLDQNGYGWFAEGEFTTAAGGYEDKAVIEAPAAKTVFNKADRCGTSKVYSTYDDTTKALTIFGNGAMPDFDTAADTPWNAYAADIKSININGAVTAFGTNAFEDCTALTKITAADDNASFKSVDGVIYSKDGKTLVVYPVSKTGTSYDISADVTSIDGGAFSGNANITAVNYSGNKTQWNKVVGGRDIGLPAAVKVYFPITSCDITVPDAVYTGSTLKPAVTVKDGETVLKADTDFTVTYTENINAGTATATITGKGEYKGTKIVNFTIAKADSAAATAPTANNLTYTGKAQALISAGTATGGEMQYSLDGKTYSTDLPTAINAGEYTVYYKVVADSNHNDTAAQTVKVTIATSDADVTAPTANKLTFTGKAQALISAGTVTGGEMQYSLDGKTYCTDLPTATNAGEYIVYYKVVADSNHNDAAAQVVKVTIAKAAIVPGVSLADWTFGETASDPIVTGNSGSSTVTLAFYQGETKLNGIPENAGSYKVVATFPETKNYLGGTAEADFTIAKADSAVATAPKANTLTYSGKAQALISAGTATGGEMEYSLDGKTYSSALPTATNAGEYTVYYKVVADSNHNDTAAQTVIVTVAKCAITITADNQTSDYGTALNTLTYKLTGEIAEGDDLGIKLATEANKEVSGTSDITVSYTANANYAVTVKNGTYTVGEAPVTSSTTASTTAAGSTTTATSTTATVANTTTASTAANTTATAANSTTASTAANTTATAANSTTASTVANTTATAANSTPGSTAANTTATAPNSTVASTAASTTATASNSTAGSTTASTTATAGTTASTTQSTVSTETTTGTNTTSTGTTTSTTSVTSTGEASTTAPNTTTTAVQTTATSADTTTAVSTTGATTASTTTEMITTTTEATTVSSVSETTTSKATSTVPVTSSTVGTTTAPATASTSQATTSAETTTSTEAATTSANAPISTTSVTSTSGTTTSEPSTTTTAAISTTTAAASTTKSTASTTEAPVSTTATDTATTKASDVSTTTGMNSTTTTNSTSTNATTTDTVSETTTTGSTTIATGSKTTSTGSTSQTTAATSTGEQGTTTTVTTTPEQPDVKDLGDSNGDGKVDAKDASLVLVSYAKASTGNGDGLTEQQRAAADVNGDGKVDAKDASTILAYYALVSTTTGEVPTLKEFAKPKES